MQQCCLEEQSIQIPIKRIHMYEKFHMKLISLPTFLSRLLKSLLWVLLLISIALWIGMLGYHVYEQIPWVDAFVNASMILSGMGPVSTLATEAGKIFAGFYALFSGLFFILTMSIILSPMAHRLFHQLHIALKTDKA